MNKETTKIIADILIDANMRFEVMTLDDRFEVKIYNKDKKTFWLIYPFADKILVDLHKIGENILQEDVIETFNFDYDEFCGEFCENVLPIITAIIDGNFNDKYKHHKTFICAVCGEAHKYSDTHHSLADIDGNVYTDKYICGKCTIHHNPYNVYDKIGLIPAYTCDSIVKEIKTYNYVKYMMG